ncbi:heme-binding protein [Pseudooceanicola sp.]|uniref:heme-binding protein n=1 Tax=Pseudooceanicola sp. TaxID=1914328 RepID=UPI00351475F2
MQDYSPGSAGAHREIRVARPNEPDLGPLRLLPGTWANIRPEHRVTNNDGTPNLFKGEGTLTGQGQSPFDGRGWNLIALPFAEAGARRNYRVLMNQYNEVLEFKFIDDSVPNRGITQETPTQNADQRVAALDYQQMIAQIKAEDASVSGTAGDPELPIHHEPGFFLHMKDQTINGFDIARLATIPHGDAAAALGRAAAFDGPPSIPPLSGFPEGVAPNIAAAVHQATEDSYLFPYRHFIDQPFKGVIGDAGFPGFGPDDTNLLLRLGMPPNVVRTTELVLETDVMEGGINNIPFIVRQANPTLMRSTFWIMELDEMDADGDPRLVLAYSQFIFLDFFGRFDGRPGLIRWPHVSINMMERIEKPARPAEEATVIASANLSEKTYA